MTRRALAAAVIAVALLAGCTAAPDAGEAPTASAPQIPLDELVPLDDPRAYEGPSTALLGGDAIEPMSPRPAQQLPVTVTSRDASGEREVTIDDTSRVLALDLAGSLAATVWGLGFGDTLVGRDVSTTFAGTEDLPLVTSGGHTVNAEAVLALRPSLVITDGTIGPRDVLAQLRDAGVTVVFVDNAPSFDGAAQLARDVGAVLGVPDAGAALADSIRAEVEATIAQVARLAPADPADRVRMIFLYLRGGAGIYYLFGEESGADVLIDALAGVDVAADIGWDGMKPATDEAIIAADPDLVLVMTGGIESAGGVDQLLAERPALALTTAGRHRRFVDMDDGVVLGFGPRSADVVAALARAIYAP